MKPDIIPDIEKEINKINLWLGRIVEKNGFSFDDWEKVRIRRNAEIAETAYTCECQKVIDEWWIDPEELDVSEKYDNTDSAYHMDYTFVLHHERLWTESNELEHIGEDIVYWDYVRKEVTFNEWNF